MSHTRTAASYATGTDLATRLDPSLLAELTAEPPSTTVDTAVLDDVCADASDTIDTYIGDPATLPAAVARLRPVCLSIAEHYLLGRRFAGRYDQTVSERYATAIDFCKMVARDATILEGKTRPSAQETQGAASGSETPVFVSDPEIVNLLPYGTWP